MLRKNLIFFILFNFSFITLAQDNSIKMKSVINLEIAKIITDVCESHQKKTGYRPVDIAIVESGGDLVLFRKQNNSFILSIDIAISKADSSASIPVSSRIIQDIAYGKDSKPGRVPGLEHSKNIFAYIGEVPIRTKNGTLLGTLGVSGAKGDKDEKCANAALLTVDEYL